MRREVRKFVQDTLHLQRESVKWYTGTNAKSSMYAYIFEDFRGQQTISRYFHKFMYSPIYVIVFENVTDEDVSFFYLNNIKDQPFNHSKPKILAFSIRNRVRVLCYTSSGSMLSIQLSLKPYKFRWDHLLMEQRTRPLYILCIS